jgi:threonine dehydratase
MDLRKAAIEAEGRIEGRLRTTPLEYSPHLSALAGCRVHLKLENQQRTGSFKLRGAMNKLLALDHEKRARGVVAASSGNHGVAVACGAAALSCPALIFVPKTASGSKVDYVRSLGGEIRQVGEDCVVAEMAAREYARERGKTYISPYNDPLIVGGQGTIGRELERQLERIDAVFVSLGGGGLISGIGGYLKAVDPSVRMVACSPANSPVMHTSLEAGRILDMASKPTLSDGTAGGVEQGSITFGLCRRIIDGSVLVDESEIRDAVRLVIEHHHTLVEGAAGVAVAGFLKEKKRFEGREVVIVLCGANIDVPTLRRIL